MSHSPPERVTLRTLRQWARESQKFAFLTCYDATTASWLCRGGVNCLLVGDTAAQVILGHDTTLPATMPFMLEITAAVRRGAPGSFVMADMPFGSYQCGDDEAVRNAMAFLVAGGADAVKLEVDPSQAALVQRLSRAGVPVVAHLGSRPQQVRQEGGYRAAGRTTAEAAELTTTAKVMRGAGASMLLLEAMPAEVSREIVKNADGLPVVGCGAGPDCHGHVVVLHDLVGLTAWHPPFVTPTAAVGQQIADAARQWAELVASGGYLRDDHPYRMKPQ